MAYVTQQDLIDRYGETALLQLADRDGDGTADAAVVQAAIDDATALVDGYLLARHALPLPGVPPLLRQVAAKVAWRALHTESVPDDVQQGYREAERVLTAIARGDIVLDLDGAGAPAGGGGAGAGFDGPARLFGRDRLNGF